MNEQKKTYWQAEIEVDKCSLCEVCANHCPTGAMRSHTEDNVLAIHFAPEICDGCEGAPKCQQLCPEVCLRIVAFDAPLDDPDERVLKADKLLLCKSCGARYAPITKAMTAASKGVANAERFKDFCPLCRRTNLVVSFTEDKRGDEAEGQAEYRQGAKLMQKGRMKSKRKVDPDQRPPTPEMDQGKGKLPPS